MPPDVAAAEMGRVREAGVDAIHFAFCREDDKPGKPHSYRVQGPTFVIEFLDVQEDSAKNPANHIHSCWRTCRVISGWKRSNRTGRRLAATRQRSASLSAPLPRRG